jgi:2-polyprenyl-3-methyl-5-hydroxy-6-metoxy-1,4-benzoquinol methylase
MFQFPHVSPSIDRVPMRRLLTAEKMDDPGLDATAHGRALAGLGRINRFSHAAGSLLRPLIDFAQWRRLTSIRLLDVACGGGDVPIALKALAADRGLHIDLTLCDRSLAALDYARKQAERAGLSVQTTQGDVVDRLPEGILDVVTNSLFLHHLTEADVVAALANMHATAGRLLLISDLRRSRLGWIAAQVGCRLLSGSAIVHYDGPVSVRAAWTTDELADMARGAGLADAQITRQRPWRMMLQWERD